MPRPPVPPGPSIGGARSKQASFEPLLERLFTGGTRSKLGAWGLGLSRDQVSTPADFRATAWVGPLCPVGRAHGMPRPGRGASFTMGRVHFRCMEYTIFINASPVIFYTVTARMRVRQIEYNSPFYSGSRSSAPPTSRTLMENNSRIWG